MKQSLGNAARDEAFYPRPKIVKAVFRILEANASIYLSAPRRVGKTSILKHLEDSNYPGYSFIYSITESVDSVNGFFKVLFDDLMASEAVGKLAKMSHSASEFIASTLGKIKSVKGVELKESKEQDYYVLLLDFFEKIDKEAGRVTIMIDEFPQTITNIFKKYGKDEAARFIQLNREMRFHKAAEQKVSFIYTGSISLYPVVEKIIALTAVNDLKALPVKPWSWEEAQDLLMKLSLADGIGFEDGAIDFLLNTIKWFIPFHLQLIYAELQTIFDDKGSILKQSDISIAVANVVDAKNKAQFAPYFSRLENLLQTNEYHFAIDILKVAAQNRSIEFLVINDLSVKHGIKDFGDILNMLCDDGYLDKQSNEFHYTSPILQLWCLKHICNED